MAALKPDVPPGWDDGPSRPGLRTRRTVIFVISGLLLVCTPIFLLMLWGMAHPSFGPGTVKPVTSTLTISLSIRQSEWSRLVQAADSFAIQHGLVDSQAAHIQPSSELGLSRVRYEGSGADLVVPLGGLVDLAKECAKLTKELGEVDKQLAGARARLSNEKFVASAPPHVIEGARTSERQLSERREQLAGKIAALCGQ